MMEPNTPPGRLPGRYEQTQLDRIEMKLDALLAALAADAEDEDAQPVDLEGNPAGREREAGTSLG